MGTCTFGRKTTDRVKNSDSITFGSSIGSTPNRFVFQMDTWPVCKNTYVLLLHAYIVCEKVLFSVVSVCLRKGRIPMWQITLDTSGPAPSPASAQTYSLVDPRTCWQVGGWLSAEKPSFVCYIIQCSNIWEFYSRNYGFDPFDLQSHRLCECIFVVSNILS